MKAKSKILLTSLATIAMSASLVVGGTYALFTSEDSVNIAVTSGTVNVKAAINQTSLKTYSMDVEQVSGKFENKGTASFDADGNLVISNVTPGDKAEFVIEIVNNSTVDILYSFESLMTAKDEEGNEVDLNKIGNGLEVTAVINGIIYNVEDNSPWFPVSAGQDIGDIAVTVNFPTDGKLKFGDANEYNQFQGLTWNIDYSVKAVQGNAKTETVVTETTGSLDNVLGKVDEGATTATLPEVIQVKTAGNVEWATGAGHGSTPFGEGNTNLKQVVIEGTSKDATFTAIGNGVGPIAADNGANLTIKNITVVDKSESYAEDSWELGYLEFAGNLTFENVHFVNAIQISGNATFKNCTFNSNAENEYDVWVGGGSATFEGCTFEGYRGLKMHEAYGLDVVEVVVNDCTFGPLAKKPGIAIGTVNAATTVIVKDSVFNNCQAGDQSKYIYETDTDVTTFNFVLQNNSIVSSVEVSDATNLATTLTNAGSAGAGDSFINLTEDLDMSSVTWTPIKVNGYNGADIVTIDGNGHTITGLNAPLFAGGFAGGSGIVIKNLTIDDSDIVSKNTIGSGAFIESVDSMNLITLQNCHLTNSTVTGGDGSRTGGLIGWTAGYNNVNDGPVKTYVTIEDCSVINCTITSEGSVGAIYGHAGNNAWTYSTVKNCTVKDCTLTSTDDGGWRVGVVVGTANVGELTISNITESGNTLTQTGKTAPEGQSNLYGRFVPDETGKLVIDGKEITA